MPDWLRALAQALFWVVAMTLTMRWLARSRLRTEQSPSNCVRHTNAMLILGVACMLGFAGLLVATHVLPFEGINFLTDAFLVCAALAPAYLVAEYRFARHLVSDEGMDFGRPTGKRLAFRWSEVREVRYGNLGRWFKIELQSGEVLRVSVAMAGLPAFADQVLRHVPAVRIERDTLRMLERTARGDLPPLW